MTKLTSESVAKVLVVNEKDEALILTVGEYKARPDKSFKPDLPGGLVEENESEATAVARELGEEAGITADPLQFSLAYAKTEFFADENKSITKFLYLLHLTETPPVTISWEHAEYAWVPLKDLMATVEFRPFYEEALQYCFLNHLLA